MINAANGIMYTDDVTKSAPITELIGPKKGTAKARNHIIATIGSRTKTLRKIDFVCTPTAFSQTRKTGWVKTTNPIACIICGSDHQSKRDIIEAPHKYHNQCKSINSTDHIQHRACFV